MKENEWVKNHFTSVSLIIMQITIRAEPFPQTANSIFSVRKMDNQTKTHKSYMPQIIILSICFFGIFFAFNTSQVRFIGFNVMFRPCKRL